MSLSRRDFILAASGGAAAAYTQFRLPAARAFAADDPLAKLDGIAQAQAIQKGELSAAEALDLAIARIERLNPKINAVVATDFERARTRARENKFSGPFAGVPFLVKDLDDFAGLPTSNGARALVSHVADKTDRYVQACVDSGFNVLGKSNTPEFGLTCVTESLALGPCYNPWDLTHSPGGSSGGAGAAVAAGLVPVAQGSDGGGSIRIPASCCGVFGLKPSRGRMQGSTDEFTFSVMGVLSRSVRDSAYALAHTERPKPAAGMKPVGLVSEPAKRRLKIGLYLQGSSGEQPAADVAAAVLATAKLCEELGHEVRFMQWQIDAPAFAADFLTLWACEAGREIDELEKELGRKVTLQDFEPLTLGFRDQYHAGLKQQEAAATERLKQASKDVARQMEPYDVVLSPVLSTAPPTIGYMNPTIPYAEQVKRVVTYVAYTPLYNAAGMPAMSVPLAWNEDGLPIGSHFAAKVGDERTLLELAYELEQSRPWADKWAPCSAPKSS